jgi:hypothetical protein
VRREYLSGLLYCIFLIFQNQRPVDSTIFTDGDNIKENNWGYTCLGRRSKSEAI